MVEKIKKNAPNKYNVPAVEQAAHLLLCLARTKESSMGLTEISEQIGLHASRTFHLLHTLSRFDFTQKTPGNKGYSLGVGLIELARKVIDNLNIPRLADPILEDLAIATDSTALLDLIINDDEIMVVGTNEGGGDIGITIKIGRRYPISHLAEGKAIAAFLPKKNLKKLLQNDELFFYGDPEKFDKKRLTEELIECRKVGYTLDLVDYKHRGTNIVAAPVLGHRSMPVGAIVVLGFFPVKRAHEIGVLVAKSANLLSRQLGAKSPNPA